MTVKRRCRTSLLACAVLLGGGGSLAGETDEPTYERRLQMPIRGDALSQPRAVVADLHGNEVFVCDSFNNRIVIFDSRGGYRYQIPGGSVFRVPLDLAADPDGFLLVLGTGLGADAIAELDFDGRFLRRLSLTGMPPLGDEPRISSLALSPSGDRLAVVDSRNHRLVIADRDGRMLHSVDMTAGRTDKEIEVLRLGRVDVYGEMVLLPVPTDGLVHLFDLEGNRRGMIGERGSAYCQTMFPVAAALDEAGRVIVLDQQRAMFMTWDLESGKCLDEHYGFGNVPGAFYQPSDLALDAAGRIFVSQGFEGRVQTYVGGRPAFVGRQLLARAETPPAVGGPEATTAKEVSDLARAAASVEVLASDVETVTGVVQAWAAAWTQQRVDDYLGFYSMEFEPSERLSRSAWREQRRERLRAPRFIEVDVEELDVVVEGRGAQALFRQSYRSNLFSDRVWKVLDLVREDETWKIRAESAHAERPALRAMPAEPLIPMPVEPLVTASSEEIRQRKAVDEAVRSWARSWEEKRVERYLAHYATTFEPAEGLSRGEWEDLRRERLTRPALINVTIEDLSIDLLSAVEATADFRQTYRSNLFTDQVRKVLRFVLEDGAWKIQEESVVVVY